MESTLSHSQYSFNSMAGLFSNILRLKGVRERNRKKLKEKARKIVEKDRLLQKQFLKVG